MTPDELLAVLVVALESGILRRSDLVVIDTCKAIRETEQEEVYE